jgi:hypothetical protein
MDRQWLIEQAARCRRWAVEISDKKMKEKLLELADEYEKQAANVVEKPDDDVE